MLSRWQMMVFFKMMGFGLKYQIKPDRLALINDSSALYHVILKIIHPIFPDTSAMLGIWLSPSRHYDPKCL